MGTWLDVIPVDRASVVPDWVLRRLLVPCWGNGIMNSMACAGCFVTGACFRAFGYIRLCQICIYCLWTWEWEAGWSCGEPRSDCCTHVATVSSVSMSEVRQCHVQHELQPLAPSVYRYAGLGCLMHMPSVARAMAQGVPSVAHSVVD